MGLFYRETRDYNPGTTSNEQVFSAFPSHIINSANLTWTEYEALRSSDIFIACTTLAKDVARLDIRIKENGIFKDADRLQNLLNNRPNDVYNGYRLKFSVMLAALLTGAGYILIERANNTPTSLFHIPTSKIQLKQDRDTGDYYYEVNSNGETLHVDYKDVLEIKPFVDDGINPISILSSLKDDLNTQNYSKRFLGNFFKNNTQNGSLLKLKDGKLSPQERNKIRDEWQKANAGENSAGKVLVMDETMDFEQLEIDTDILKLITSNKASTVSIAAAFGLPPFKLGIESPNSSQQEMSNDYLFNTLSSYFKVITAELNFKLLSSKDDYKRSFEFDTSAYRSIDWNTYVETLLRQLDKGAITLDEYRASLGMPPVPDGLGAKHRVDLNHINLEAADDYQLRDKTTNNQSVNVVDTESSQGGDISE